MRRREGGRGGGVQVCSYSRTKIIPEVRKVQRTDHLLIITNVQKCKLLALLVRGFILIRIRQEHVN